jgi:hypothetical protein
MSVKRIDLDQSHQYVNDVYEAVEIAKQFQSAGIFNLFRGQIRNFPVSPSIFRRGIDRQLEIDKLNKFYQWANEIEELKSLHNSEDAILAVAQHHGFKTNFLDFTRNPEIAGFFSCDVKNGELPQVTNEEEELSCIICVNRELLIKSWERENSLFYAREQRHLVRIVDIKISNHFRLQTQEGVFLEMCVDASLLEAFSGFYRILFPYIGEYRDVDKNKIYPVEKSHLEQLIDEYLTRQKIAVRLSDLEKSGFFQKTIECQYDGIPNAFITGELPLIHQSWKNEIQKVWQIEPDENYTEIHTDQTFNFIFKDDDNPHQCAERIIQGVTKLFDEDKDIRKKSISWDFSDEQCSQFEIDYFDVEKDEERPIICGDLVALIWNGVRRLPYTNEQIAHCISNYICLEKYGQKYFGEITYLELSSNDIRTKGFATEETLIKCVRADYRELASDLEKGFLKSSSDMMSAVPFPSRLFEFSRFTDLFVRQIIPSQMYCELDGTTIIYSPVRVNRFGNS